MGRRPADPGGRQCPASRFAALDDEPGNAAEDGVSASLARAQHRSPPHKNALSHVAP